MSITNDRVKEYIYGLYRPLNDELARLRQVGERGHIPIILKDTERLLITMIKKERPKRILEIGTAIGYSAAVLATAAGRDAIVTTVEADPLYAGDARGNLMGYGNVELIEGDGAEVMNEMAGEPGFKAYDMVFIDAAKSHYMEFWEGALKVTRPGSTIICDNVLMQGKTADESLDERGRFETNIKYMRNFLEHISDCPEAETSIIPVGDGMSISVVR